MIDTPFVQYLETKPQFLILPLLKTFSMTVWITIDDRYSNYCPLYRNEAIFLDCLPLFTKLFIMTVWNTIDDRYSNFVFYIETKPYFLIFTSFKINFIVFSVKHFRSKPIVQCDKDRDRNDMKGSKRHGSGHQIYLRTISFRRLVFPEQFYKQHHLVFF